MLTTARCLVVGEALVDVVGGVPHPGGSPMNVAVGLSRLGLATRLLTRIGDDPHGRMLGEHLAREGVAVVPTSMRAGERTSRAVAVIGADGAAAYDFDIEWDVSAEVAIAEAAGVDVVHVGSLGAVLDPGADVVRAMIDAVPDGILRTYDPNIRGELLGPRAAATERVEAIMAASHIVKLSDEDAEWLYPGCPIDDVLARVIALGARLAVVTRGGDGCVSLIEGGAGLVEREAPPVQVVDTIGAGDSFMSGLIHGVVSDGLVPALAGDAFHPDARDLTQFERVTEAALAGAAVTVSRRGANPPRLSELAISSR